jgi:hypothetical protein
VVTTAPRLEVRVTVANRGDRAASPVDVVGELFGERREARLLTITPGGAGNVVLDFPPPKVRPGVHALALPLEYPVQGAPDGAGSPPTASQRAWLLLALGARPDPAVRLLPSTLSLDVRGPLGVRLSSADGQPHRVRLRALTARGLRAEGEGVEVAVPGAGPVAAALPLVRVGAPRGSRQTVLLVAETLDGPLARTTVATAVVDVAPMPGLVPQLRPVLLALALVLLSIGVGFEVRWRRPSST